MGHHKWGFCRIMWWWCNPITLLNEPWWAADFPLNKSTAHRSYSMSVMLTSSQTEQRCQLAFGWRTAKPLCPEGLSRNAKMKTGNETVRREELQICIYIKKYPSMSRSPALPVYYDELFPFSVMTSQSPSCWWIPCSHRGNLPELTNTKNSFIRSKIAEVYWDKLCSLYVCMTVPVWQRPFSGLHRNQPRSWRSGGG